MLNHEHVFLTNRWWKLTQIPRIVKIQEVQWLLLHWDMSAVSFEAEQTLIFVFPIRINDLWNFCDTYVGEIEVFIFIFISIHVEGIEVWPISVECNNNGGRYVWPYLCSLPSQNQLSLSVQTKSYHILIQW